jgi:para-nitrobenzyl esterase
MGGVLGACHGLDIPLTFGTFGVGLSPLLLGDPAPPEAAALSERIRTAWTSFAAHGDPGWPGYDPARRLTRVWDTDPVVVPYPEEASRVLWQDHVFAALPLLAGP